MLIPKFNLYKAEWLDLVFDDRNKSYGAYELRSHYAQTMNRAITITVASVLAAVLTINIVTKRPKLAVVAQDKTTVVDLTKVMQPPPATKPVKPASTPPATQTHVKTVVIPTHVTADPIKNIDPPTITDINTSAIGTETHKGDETGANTPVTNVGTIGGKGTDTKSNDDTGIYSYADVSPEPNGGMAGWSRFLQSHIRYPDTEVQGRVILSFVVERDGSLTDIKVVKSVDSQLDAEAVRVLKIAPKWKPGMQGGKAVRVQYTIPINFQLNN